MRSWASTFLFVAALFALTCSAHAEKRVALVIGNSAYENAPQLSNPAKDAVAVMYEFFRLTLRPAKFF